MAGERAGRRVAAEPGAGLFSRALDPATAKVLDPGTAYRIQGQSPPRPAPFLAETVLVRGWHPETEQALERVAGEAGFRLEWDPTRTSDRQLIERAGLSQERTAELLDLWVTRAALRPIDDAGEPVFRPIDTWRLLQTYRAEVDDPVRQSDVALEHPTELGIDPAPFTGSHSVGLAQYAVAGSGGRQPVAWVGPAPVARSTAGRRPVVAVLDSGVGEHPWLGQDHVLHDPQVLGEPIGIPSLLHEVEQRPEVADTEQLVGELGPDAGHGTFIAGLVRQACPEARILSVRLFRDSGVVDEAELLRALQLLALHQLRAIDGDPDCPSVDVVSLSLGYYHEQPDDPAFDPLLAGPIALLGRLGVAVVVSAGNDATERPSYPAAFAAIETPGAVPVCAVGALNPDGTIALFSNDGPWVRYLRPGAALVSTLPTTLDGSMEATNRLVDERGEERSGIDPDGFQSGFAVWSGTSFAAPVFAGQLAARLCDRFAGGDPDPDPDRAVARVTEALAGMPGRGSK